MHKKVVGDVIYLTGEADSYEEKFRLGKEAVKKGFHVVNNIDVKECRDLHFKHPNINDKSLEGLELDVLVIGGGISGCSILRELTKYNLKVALIEKEGDVAFAASGRNDGEVHPGVDLKKGSLKQSLVVKSNRMYDKVCSDLNVKFRRCGQQVLFMKEWHKPFVKMFVHNRIHKCGVDDTKIISREELLKYEPNVSKDAKFSMYNPMAGTVCPYNLTVAYAENAIQNGAKVYLNTMCLGLNLKHNSISEVITNRGKIKAKVIVNASGTFAEELAKMANDQFYSIHFRKGVDFILDKKAYGEINTIVSFREQLASHKGNSKGGGVLTTVDGNLLVGPDAKEIPYPEDYSVDINNINGVYNKQIKAIPGLNKRDIITYFAGVRAATYEEDFVIEWGRNCKNLYHVAGIQSPGLTTAPLVALNVSKDIANRLEAELNDKFNPIRKGYGHVNELSNEERAALIKKDPNYGIIICRCEEISKGEILDCLKAPLPCYTIDQIKKRVRCGMGRCQGGFCQPLVHQIIADYHGLDLDEVKKNSTDSYITMGDTKGGEQ